MQDLKHPLAEKYPTQWWHFNNNNWTEPDFIKYLEFWVGQFSDACSNFEELEAYSSEFCIYCADERPGLIQVTDKKLGTPIMVCKGCSVSPYEAE